MNDFTDEHNRLIQEARAQIEQQQYDGAINNLDCVIQNNETDGYAFFLRGKAYGQLKQYKMALSNYETALSIYQQADNKKYQIHTLIELTFVYPFNGKVKEGFLAQQQSYQLAKKIDVSADDPLYSYISSANRMSDASLDKMQSSLQKINSVPAWDKFGVMGKMMGYATRGKPQSYLYFAVWLIMAVLVLLFSIIFIPFWLPVVLYKNWRSRKNRQ